MIDIRLHHRFADFSIQADMCIPQGLSVLFGRSGSGKTTLINAVAGLLRPDHARIVVQGTVFTDTALAINLAVHQRRIGYIFQDSRLFPHMNVLQNLLYGQRFLPRGTPKPDPDPVIKMLDIKPLLNRRPAGLSGGEKQRVAIGRVLLAAPRVILADEPLAALDEQRKAEILPYFERLRDAVQVPVLYVSHSVTEVARLATTIITLDNGRVTGQGTASDILADPDLTPLGPRKAGAMLSAQIKQHHSDGLTEITANGQSLFVPGISGPVGSAVRVRIAAHDVILFKSAPQGSSALNIIAAHVTDIRSGHGPGVIIALQSLAGRLLARITARSCQAMELTPGTKVYAVIKSVAVAPGDIGPDDSATHERTET